MRAGQECGRRSANAATRHPERRRERCRRPSVDGLASAEPAHAASPHAGRSRRADQGDQRALNYHPNAAAHSLRTNRTRTVGIVVPDITNPVFPPIIRGIEDALAQRGYLAMLANTDGRLDREAEIADLLAGARRRRIDPGQRRARDETVSRLAADGLPIVTVNRRVDDERFPRSSMTRTPASCDVLRHLAGLGHRTVAKSAGPQAMSTGVERYRAFERQSQRARPRRRSGPRRLRRRLQRGGRRRADRGAASSPDGLHRAGLRQRSAGDRRDRRTPPSSASIAPATCR